MSQELNWRENEEISVEEPKKETQDEEQEIKNKESTTEQNEENDNDSKNAQNVTKEICKYYKNGKCHYGKSGKKMDKRGKICAFSHPITCKKFDNFGFKENGCKNRKCEKLHLNVCKIFMRHKLCKYGEDCRFYHPKKLKNSNQMKPENQSSQKHNEEQP